LKQKEKLAWEIHVEEKQSRKKELPPDGGERRKQQMRYEESEGPV
jgi:hypothetical protein